VVIHLYYKLGGEQRTVTTPRVTRLPNSIYLHIGTEPNVETVDMRNLEWFFMEED